MFNEKLEKLFDVTVQVVFAVILFFLVLGIAIGAIQLSVSVWQLFQLNGITGRYIDIITDVLTLYVLVELSRSLVDYFSTHRLRLTFIVDASIIFVLRELLIGLFKHKIEADMIYALSALILVLGMLRIASIVVYQREKKLLDTGDVKQH